MSIRVKMLAKNCLRAVWARRHVISKTVKGVFRAVNWVYVKLPIPHKARVLLRDVFFLSLEHFILNTQTYHSWLRARSGTGRIHALLGAPSADSKGVKLPPSPSAPTQKMWLDLKDLGKGRGAAAAKDAQLDVIVPVYRGYDETLNCLYTALNTPNTTAFELVVINDCSPEPALTEKLQELHDLGILTLLSNTENLGFVATVNRGMKLHTDRDVILLNSDTECYNNWVDRLMDAARAHPRIASVTPLSNNAEICSYPYTVQDNPMALEISYAELDALAGKVNKDVHCDVPTAVGFCMVIKRAALNDVGYFDEETFGRGYGEENDFCLRAIAKGWRHSLTGSVFVRHLGGTSFAGEKHKRVMAALKILHKKYPHYHASVAKFIADDPAKPMRQRLDTARLMQRSGTVNMLMVNHNLGGGTLRHVEEMLDALDKEQVGGYMLEPMPAAGSGMMKLAHPHLAHTPNLIFSMEYDREAFFEALLRLQIAHVHVHHVIGYEHRFLDFLTALTQKMNLRYDVTVHDYFMICPRINLVDSRNHYCGEPAIEACEKCVQENHSHAGTVPVWQWRLHFEQFLNAARMVFVPSGDVGERLARYYPKAPIALRWHPELFTNGEDLSVPAPRSDEPLVVGIVGAISDIKGADVILQLANNALKRKLNLKFVIIGHTSNIELNSGKANVTITGAYKEHEMANLLKKHKPHVVFIPSVWPETYCYTISIAWRFGILPIAFDIGAPAERIRACGRGIVFPLALKDDMQALADKFMTLKLHGLEDAQSGRRPVDREYDHLLKDYYQLDVSDAQPFLHEAIEEDEL